MNKLDLIIDVLDGITNGNYNPRLAKEALAAARELRALEPVAWADWSLDGVQYSDRETTYGEPLYALDEVTK